MSMSDDYLALKDAISARSEEDNKNASMAIAVYVAEAEAAYQVAVEDEGVLKGAGFDWAKVELLPQLCGAVREAQSLWNADRFDQADAQEEWDAKLDGVYGHLDFCLHAMNYAYRNDEKLLQSVKQIEEGTGGPDLVQDLNDTAVSGRENSELFAAINFDMANFDIAAMLAGEMSSLLARKESSESKSERKAIRDKAFSWLKEIIDELYACGQYAFWKDEKRKKMYASAYLRNKNRRNYLESKRAKALEQAQQ